VVDKRSLRVFVIAKIYF